MSDSDESFENVNPGKVPMDSFNIETDTEIIHVDTFDLEAAKRYKAERHRLAVSQDSNPRLDQNAQHSG